MKTDKNALAHGGCRHCFLHHSGCRLHWWFIVL